MLTLVNTASFEQLDLAVGLRSDAAGEIIAHRRGPDGDDGTSDDDPFDDLTELDAVPYVGRHALAAMLDHVDAADIECGDVELQLLAFNDLHGNLEPPGGSSGRIQTGADPLVDRVDAGGLEFFATHMAALRSENPNTLVVTAGDLIGGSPLLSALFHDEPTIEAMNMVGLDIAGVGNHEFDEGATELLRMVSGGCHPVDGCQDDTDFAGASFAFLAANVEVEATGAPILPGYTIRRVGQARVAFIGLTLEGTPLLVSAAGIEGLHFRDEAETINEIVDELRPKGIETFVVLLHEGGAQTGLLEQCEGISGPIVGIVDALDDAVDVVISAHTHQSYICDLGGTLVVSGASFGRLITDVDLVIDELSGDVVSASARNVVVTRDVDAAAEHTALISRYKDIAAPFANRVVGSIAVDLGRTPDAAGESAMGAVVADAQLAATRAPDRGDAVIAFMNPGGVRGDLLFAQTSGGEQPGEVTFGESFTVQPFGNNLVTMDLSGAQIVALLEQQWSLGADGTERATVLAISAGFTYAWDPSRPIGARVVPESVALDGAPLDASRSYRVTCNSFLATGGDGFSVFSAGTDRVGGVLDLDALEAYFTDNSPLAAPAPGRIVRRAPV
ncbi:MAG: bifunctional metallophosphatase/5'-nucleotidase [Deltaproteobacteria bacterium]|nr:bifunctional metallophosphatase/5'-nucleotidase [Nannocystaceae bacterium]